MTSSRKGLILAFVLLIIAFFYYAPIIPSDVCPSLIGKCASLGGENLSLPTLIDAWMGFLLP